jgi:hypothetical protein
MLLLLLLYFFLSPFLSASPLHTLAHIHPANLDHCTFTFTCTIGFLFTSFFSVSFIFFFFYFFYSSIPLSSGFLPASFQIVVVVVAVVSSPCESFIAS